MSPDDPELKNDRTSADKDGAISSSSEDGAFQPAVVGVGADSDDGVAPAGDILPNPPIGYQLLTSDAVPAHADNDDDDDSEESDESLSGEVAITANTTDDGGVTVINSTSQPPGVSNFELHTRQEVATVWSSASQGSSGEQASGDSQNNALIRECLSSFSLPAENIPAWVAQVPEDQWKDALLDRLKHINEQQ